MNTLRVMGIIGIVLSAFSFIFIVSFMEADPEAAMGWGIIAALYLLAYSIVGTVQGKDKLA